KHLDGLAAIDGVTVTSVISRRIEQAQEVARKYGVEHASTDLAEALARDDVDAVILCTPTQLHAQQAIAAMRAGKHVQAEIPHAAHTVDLFQYQAGEDITVANAVQGPMHPELGIAMDMSVQLRTQAGRICTLSLSFNNDGPLGTFFRYICDNGTYIARYDDLV